MAKQSDELTVGDSVILKSGQLPIVVIERIYDGVDEKMAQCCWIAGNKKCGADFFIATLEYYDPNEAGTIA